MELTRFKHVWLYDATYGKWNIFQSEGIWGLNNDDLDYSQFSSFEEYKAYYEEHNSNPTNTRMLFSNYALYGAMEEGDCIIVRKGLQKLLGYGIVGSEYKYDASRQDIKSYRLVDWTLKEVKFKIKNQGIWFNEIDRKQYSSYCMALELDLEPIDMLIDHLIAFFKELHEKKPFNGMNERYKWVAAKEAKGKSPLEIVNILRKSDNANLVYNLSLASLGDLVREKPEELVAAVSHLFDDTKPLEDRLFTFQKEIDSIVPEGKTRPSDLRTAAALLSLHDMQRYVYFMMEGTYQPYCEYLGVPFKTEKNTQITHFLELLAPLAEKISTDEEIQAIFRSVTNDCETSHLLSAQTIIWCMQGCWNQIKNNITKNTDMTTREQRMMIERQFKSYLTNCVSSAITKDPLTESSVRDIVKHIDANFIFQFVPELRDGIESFFDITDIDVLLKKLAQLRDNPSFDNNDRSRFRQTSLTHYVNFLKARKFFSTADDAETIEVTDNGKYKEIIELLLANHNLILTGAPGTGKTYLAKQVAKAMNAETLFVQFHPSYDYTDFIEGLRPIKGEDSKEIGFERKNGVFKEFCKQAIHAGVSNSSDNFEECWSKLVDKLNDEDIVKIPLLSGKGTFDVEINDNGDGLASRTYEDGFSKDAWLRGKSKFFNHDQLYLVYKGLPGVPTRAHDNYRKAIIDYMKKNLGLINYSEDYAVAGPKKKYICIIDEINRGELSKIFGELFFSIDPGYRGIEGRVTTQYQNLLSEDDPFKDGFYIPENVYILGTMNDIDRSVESMDFAMRRRFTFKEIDADNELSISMLDDLGEKAEEAKLRMKNLNSVIAHTEGLGKPYQIGPAYFRKLKNFGGDFEKLWLMNLENLLREYLRGFRNSEDLMLSFKKAYDSIIASLPQDQSVDSQSNEEFDE